MGEGAGQGEADVETFADGEAGAAFEVGPESARAVMQNWKFKIQNGLLAV
jgi:hypothetical protein